MINKTTLTGAVTAALIAFGAPLAAQDTETPVEPAQIEADAVTDAQIEAFVDAVMAVEEVRLTYAPLIEGKEEAEAREELAKEASVAAQEAIEDTENMTTAEYLGIGQAASGSKELNERIIAELRERREEQADEPENEGDGATDGESDDANDG